MANETILNQTLRSSGSLAGTDNLLLQQAGGTYNRTTLDDAFIAAFGAGCTIAANPITIDSSGNVMIGSGTAAYKLDVNSGADGTAAATFRAVTNRVRFIPESTYVTIDSTDLAQTGNVNMSLGQAGNIGFGTNTFTNKINIVGSIRIESGNINGTATDSAYTISANPSASLTTGGYVQVFGSTAGGAPYRVALGNNNASHFYIEGTGQVFAPNLSTTASAANLFYNNATGEIQESTSSLAFKNVIEPMKIEWAQKVLEFEEIFYESTIPTDREGWNYYGYGAEQIAKIDPRYVHWTDKNAKARHADRDRVDIENLKRRQEWEKANAEIVMNTDLVNKRLPPSKRKEPKLLPAPEMLEYTHFDEELVERGVGYDRMTVAHNMLIRDQYAQIEELKKQIAELRILVGSK